MAEITTRIVLRNDTAEAWGTDAGKATTLHTGEAAVEIKDGKAKLKIATAENQTYAEAPYFGAPEAQVFQVELAENALDIEEAIADVVGDAELAPGDVVIVKAGIAGDKKSYTSYVWDGANWAATDGNYNAENVYFGTDITLAGSYDKVGNVALSDGTLRASGKSLAEVMQSIFTKELYPTADLPTLTLSGDSDKTGEAGDSYALPTVTLTVTDVGSYTYGPETGIKFTANKLTLAQGAVASATNKTTNSADFVKDGTLSLTATDTDTKYTDSAKSYTFNASGEYTQGAMPKTNLGNDYEDVRIAAGTATATARTIKRTGWRNYWYGFISTTSYNTIKRNTTSNSVGDGTKTLTAGGAAITSKTLPTITAAAGDRMPVVVIPTSSGKKVTSASMPGSLNAPVTFTKLGTVNLEGKNGYTAVSYDVWGYIADDMPVGADFSIVIG